MYQSQKLITVERNVKVIPYHEAEKTGTKAVVAYFKILFQHSPEETEGNQEKSDSG
jgi:hypothetical protein